LIAAAPSRAAGIAVALGLVACASGAGTSAGGINGTTYENPSLGLRVVLPANWAFMAAEHFDVAVADAAAKGPPKSTFAKASMERSRTVFSMLNLGRPPAPGAVPRTVVALVETIGGVLVGMTSDLYAGAIQTNLQAANREVRFEPRRAARLADRDFVVLATEMVTADGLPGRQDFYVRVDGDRALTILFTYPIDESGPPPEALEAIQPFP
jgi:hypothetical protein